MEKVGGTHPNPAGTTRRRWLTGAAGAGGAALMAACGALGGTDGGTNAAEKGAGKAPVTVEYWTFWPAARLDIVRPHLPTFEQRSGYIKAEVSMVGDFRPKLRTAIVAGTPPDASIGDVFSAALYGDQKVLLQLDPLLKRDRITLARDYVLNGFEHWCGRAYAFPLDGFAMAMVYNKSMFRQRGIPDPWDDQKGQWTWADFEQALTKLTRDEVVGFHPDAHQVARGYHPFYAANGGEYFDYDAMRYVIDQPRVIEAMEWLHALAVRRGVMTTPDGFTELNRATAGNPFAAGRLGILGDDGATAAPQVVQLIADRFEWDVVPYPRRRVGDPSYGLVGGNGNWSYVKARHPEEGYELIKFMGGDEVQGAIGQSRIVPPAQWKARRDPNGFLKAPPRHMHVFNDVWESGHFRTNRAYHYRDLELGPMLDRTVHTAFRDEATMKDALLEANRLGNSQVEFGERCYKPAWKRR
jgi:multiple sugar transport system substrate-binding protein